MNPKFSPALARMALVKAEADARIGCIKHRYTKPQLVEIESRILSVRERGPVAEGEKRILAETTAA